MKRILSLMAVSCLAILGTSIPALTSSGGSPRGRSGSPASSGRTCATSGCHSGPNVSSQTISITTDIPASGFEANTDYTITVTANTNGATGNRIGYMASVEDASGAHQGTLSTADSRSQKAGDYMTHRSSSLTPTGGSNSWDFAWNSGSAVDGTTVYVAVNFANGNGSTSGDEVDATSLALNKSTIGLNENLASDLNIFSNTNQETIIRYESSHVGLMEWSIYNLNGQMVASGTEESLGDSGEISISNAAWTGGIYILHLKGNDRISSEKFLVL